MDECWMAELLVKYLPHLQGLKLFPYESGPAFELIVRGLKYLTSINIMSSKGIQDKQVIAMAESLPNLRELTLEFTFFRRLGFSSIINNMPMLTLLKVYQNNLGGTDWKETGELISRQLPLLNILELKKVMLVKETAIELAEGLAYHPKLKSLDISWNELKGTGTSERVTSLLPRVNVKCLDN